MQAPPRPLNSHACLSEITAEFLAQGRSALPVVDGDGMLIGMLQARELEREAGTGDQPDAADLVRGAPEIFPGEDLAVAVDYLAEDDRDAVPVLASGTRLLVGWIEHRDLLRAYAGKLGDAAGLRPRGRPVNPPTRVVSAPTLGEAR